ncbi:Lrp/AsnC family transcriptional regulator [Amycolatopsis thermophila]|uniref:DNA-binding Lrp family transcriptional regulator n=1 Tax=Amycolatopsis thermophila TaxID=206084 RepID=A0ABU0F0A6_9PSEU|nr:Lrp/AsnC family transcriptional regulator [Amycolatopsis thermophila]MDQ0380497.1 DNA-binding Lrp family transcriptional regulator [Amycolatopsis thermophila]
MPHDGPVDAVDARILLELARHPRATTLAIADRVGISRNTAQSRLGRLERSGALESFEHRISPAALGYPLTAFITAQVTQRLLDEVAAALADVPEVLQVQGISGPVDLMIQVVARDADDLYRIAGRVLAIPGVERTNTALVMRQLVGYRLTPLLHLTTG